LILRVTWSVDIVSVTGVWPPGERTAVGLEEYEDLPEDSPWGDDQFVAELGADVRDVLAGVEESRLPELAAAWVGIEEFASFADSDSGWSESLIEQFVGLARRARAVLGQADDISVRV
jgi:hypothetical protein